MPTHVVDLPSVLPDFQPEGRVVINEGQGVNLDAWNKRAVETLSLTCRERQYFPHPAQITVTTAPLESRVLPNIAFGRECPVDYTPDGANRGEAFSMQRAVTLALRTEAARFEAEMCDRPAAVKGAAGPFAKIGDKPFEEALVTFFHEPRMDKITVHAVAFMLGWSKRNRHPALICVPELSITSDREDPLPAPSNLPSSAIPADIASRYARLAL